MSAFTRTAPRCGTDIIFRFSPQLNASYESIYAAATEHMSVLILTLNGYQQWNKVWAINNSCITITRHNMSSIHNINPMTRLKQWNYRGTQCSQSLSTGVRIFVHFSSSRDTYVNGIALPRKIHCHREKTLMKLGTEATGIRPQTTTRHRWRKQRPHNDRLLP